MHRAVRRHRTIAASIVLAAIAACLTMIRWQSNSAALAVPTVIQHKVIGYSVQHRPITAYRLGDPASRVKAVLLGQMHGDEKAGISVASAILHGRPIYGIDLWVVPTLNPDGNAANIRGNAHRVDLNRNWPDHWARLTGQFYSGPQALSEPETKAMYAFVYALKPTLMVSIHEPLNGVDTTDGGARNPAFARRLATGIGLALKPFRCGSVCLGTMTGWITNHQYGSAITVEFPAHPAQSWLTGRTPPAIIAAFGGHYDTSARHNPTLQVDRVSAVGSTVTIAGWTFDPDNRAKSISVYVYEGRTRVAVQSASRSRPDVNRIFHLTGGHGFLVTLTATNGSHTYCTQANNIVYGNVNPRKCKALIVHADPAGAVDAATTQSGTVTLTGWAADPDTGATSSSIQVREGDTVIGTFAANRPSPSANNAHHLTGPHGFTARFAAPAGRHTYTVYAVHVGSGQATSFVALGTRIVTVAAPAAAPPAAPPKSAAPKSAAPTSAPHAVARPPTHSLPAPTPTVPVVPSSPSPSASASASASGSATN